jgi:hypothetical protein
MTKYPSGAVAYGKLYRTCFWEFHKNLGIKTPDMHSDCLAAALHEIEKVDDNPTIVVHFNTATT